MLKITVVGARCCCNNNIITSPAGGAACRTCALGGHVRVAVVGRQDEWVGHPVAVRAAAAAVTWSVHSGCRVGALCEAKVSRTRSLRAMQRKVNAGAEYHHHHVIVRPELARTPAHGHLQRCRRNALVETYNLDRFARVSGAFLVASRFVPPDPWTAAAQGYIDYTGTTTCNKT